VAEPELITERYKCDTCFTVYDDLGIAKNCCKQASVTTYYVCLKCGKEYYTKELAYKCAERF